MKTLMTFLLLSSAVACTTTAVDPEELMAADRRFQSETAERGASGWVDAFALDGKLVSGGGVIEGRDAIGEAMAVLDSPDYSLTWEPEFAEASSDLGYTYGTYIRATSDSEGNKAVETGRYLTMWRRDSEGAWKVVIDMGSPAP